MLQGEHSTILSTFIKLLFVIKICVLSILVGVLHMFYCIPLIRVSLVASRHMLWVPLGSVSVRRLGETLQINTIIIQGRILDF